MLGQRLVDRIGAPPKLSKETANIPGDNEKSKLHFSTQRQCSSPLLIILTILPAKLNVFSGFLFVFLNSPRLLEGEKILGLRELKLKLPLCLQTTNPIEPRS